MAMAIVVLSFTACSDNDDNPMPVVVSDDKPFPYNSEIDESVRPGDDFYRYVFGLVADNALKGGLFAGCNFWGWGGRANPVHEQWQVGDDYTGDPAQEQQGLNSVFFTDKSTLEVIREQVSRISQAGQK